MNKYRFICQLTFNDNWNGYRSWHDGDWDTCVNYQWVGLYSRYCLDELRYVIR